MGYYWDKNGNIVSDTTEQVPLSFIEKQQRKLQALGDNVQSWLNNSNPNNDAYKQKANLALGLITAPIGSTATLTSGIAKPLMPLLGKRIGQNVAQGIGSGLTGGAVEGFGRGLIENENPFKTMAKDSVLGGTLGGLGGYGLGKITKNLEKQRILNTTDNSAMLNNWFNDYVDGLSNKTKLLAEYRGLKQGIDKGNFATEHLFIGENAFNAPKGKLMEAKQMAMYDEEPETIFQKTGWFKSVDDKWRFEIPDEEIIQNPKMEKNFDDGIGTYYTTTLGNLYNAPELYKNYPQLRDRSIIIQDMPDGTSGSSWGNSISLNRNLYRMPNPKWVQQIKEIEGNPEYLNFKKYENDILNKLDNIDLDKDGNFQIYDNLLYELDNKTKEFYNNNPVGLKYSKLAWHTPKNERLIEGFGDNAKSTLLHELQHQIQDIEGFARGGNNFDKDYKKLAGEVEARLASQRRNLTPEQRKIYFPMNESTFLSNYGYDVLPEKQIVNFGNKLYEKLTNDLNYRNEWVKIGDKNYRVLNLPKKDYGKILHILDTNIKIDDSIGETIKKADDMYEYTFKKVSPTEYKFINRKKIK